MGLGIFIASTLLERTGANILYLNDADKGAVVEVTWNRDDIEEHGDAWENIE